MASAIKGQDSTLPRSESHMSWAPALTLYHRLIIHSRKKSKVNPEQPVRIGISIFLQHVSSSAGQPLGLKVKVPTSFLHSIPGVSLGFPETAPDASCLLLETLGGSSDHAQVTQDPVSHIGGLD